MKVSSFEGTHPQGTSCKRLAKNPWQCKQSRSTGEMPSEKHTADLEMQYLFGSPPERGDSVNGKFLKKQLLGQCYSYIYICYFKGFLGLQLFT